MFNVGRNAWLQAGLPVETPATTVDRQCGSAQQAVNFGAALVAAGVHDAVIGSGVEHMGHVPMGVGFNWVDQVGAPWPQELMDRYALVPQGLSAEMIADQWEIPRSELDELGVRSHRLAHQATEEGRFEREIVPMHVNGDTYVTDQGIRPDTTLEKLAELKPAFKPDGKITAGNSCPLNDGAAAVLVMSRQKADSLGIEPLARVVASAVSGNDPEIMGVAPIDAIPNALAQAGMTIGDVDFVELNEAFAAQVVPVCEKTGVDIDSQLNPHGGAIALGHPFGMTGARIMTTLLNDLQTGDKTIGL